MLKYSASLLLVFSLPAAAEVINPYQAKDCRYEGAVNAQHQPEGKGVLQCAQGRRYEGQFKKGAFSGKGVYHVGSRTDGYLPPFNANATKLRNMVLSGTFKEGLAHGKFRVQKDSKNVFVITFKNGMMSDVKLAK